MVEVPRSQLEELARSCERIAALAAYTKSVWVPGHVKGRSERVRVKDRIRDEALTDAAFITSLLEKPE